jgi:hypothetical protein
MKKSTLYILAALSFLSGRLIAQTDTNHTKSYSNKVSGVSMSVGFGYISLTGNGTSILNKRLADNGLAPLSNQYASWDIDPIHFIYRNTVFNLGLGGPLKQNTVNDSSKTTLTGFIFNISLGTILCHSRKIIIYPMIGVTFNELDIDSYYSGFKSGKDISGSNNYTCISPSLTLDYFLGNVGHNVNWDYATKIPCSCIISFTVGYLYCPATTYWNDNNFDVTNRYTQNVSYPVTVIGSVTKSNLSSFYASIKFGFGIHHTCEKI